jgi:hypothetical protein
MNHFEKIEFDSEWEQFFTKHCYLFSGQTLNYLDYMSIFTWKPKS